MSLGPTNFPEGILEVLGQREFENLLIGRVGRVSAGVAQQYGDVRDLLAQLRSLIERELDSTLAELAGEAPR